MATNTIKFIDGQINRVSDSLDIIEQQLKEFKQKHPNLDVIDKEFGTFFQKQRTEKEITEFQIHLSF